MTGNYIDSAEISTDVTQPQVSDRNLAEKIWIQNEGNKRINGHDATYYANSFGVDPTELFPPDGRSANIGDPWQKLDEPGVVNFDYEPGEVAEFQSDFEEFKVQLSNSTDSVASSFQQSLERIDDKVTLKFLQAIIPRVEELRDRTNIAQLWDLVGIAEEFKNLRSEIEKEIQRETANESGEPDAAMNSVVRDLWYLAAHGSRAQDCLDWVTEIKERYKEFERDLPDDLSEDERERLLRNEKKSLIGEIRLNKRLKQAEFVQAMFPFLPVKDASFDRFVAFWSISTYVFPALEMEDFAAYWEEIYRVLKSGGKAYIYPLYYDYDDYLLESLRSFQNTHPDFVFEFRDVPGSAPLASNHSEYLYIEKLDN